MPWRHRCTACCGKSILRDITVTFLYIFPKTLLRSWTWLYHQKANKTMFPTISCPYGNIVNFSHTSRIHFSANNTSFHPFKWVRTDTDTQKWKQYICHRQFHSVHLADIILLWLMWCYNTVGLLICRLSGAWLFDGIQFPRRDRLGSVSTYRYRPIAGCTVTCCQRYCHAHISINPPLCIGRLAID